MFSERCALCGALLIPERPWAYPLCETCVDSLPERNGLICSSCSSPLVSEDGICTRCRERAYAFSFNYSLFLYEGRVRELIHQYKNKNCKSLSGFFADRMAALIVRRFSEYLVVPVPFRAARKRARGWDQIEAICRKLRGTHGIASRRLLKRERSPAQKTLDYAGRLSNLEGKICVLKKARPPEKILLIDDVFTTGATADICAGVLKKAGTSEVCVLTIALDQ